MVNRKKMQAYRERLRKERNIWNKVDGGWWELYLSSYNTTVLIDDEDKAKCEQYTWMLGKNGYIVANTYISDRYTQILMHRLILGDVDSNPIDHIDNDRTNNLRNNLRFRSNQRNRDEINQWTKTLGGWWELYLPNQSPTLLIDDIDKASVDKYTWYIDKSGYARTTEYTDTGKKTKKLHRIILNPKDNEVVEHCYDKNDYRRSNLQIRCINTWTKTNDGWWELRFAGNPGVSLIDDCDIEKCKKYIWHVNNYGYVKSILPSSNGVRKEIFMHRYILDADKKYKVDHKSLIKLDNRRCNIRLCTSADNSHNQPKRAGTSFYKGVHIDRRTRRWIAAITTNYKTHHIGSFVSEVQAAYAYDRAAVIYHGKFAKTNQDLGLLPVLKEFE